MRFKLRVEYQDGYANLIAETKLGLQDFLSPVTGRYYEDVYVCDVSSGGWIVLTENLKIAERNMEGHVAITEIEEI